MAIPWYWGQALVANGSSRFIFLAISISLITSYGILGLLEFKISIL